MSHFLKRKIKLYFSFRVNNFECQFVAHLENKILIHNDIFK